jgi:hypothetical protein
MALCLLCGGPGNAGAAPRTSVIGGEPAPISSFPFMARIIAREGVSGIGCSGTVVAPNMVLTAAHCLLNEPETAYLDPAGFEVMTGTGNLAVPGTVSGAERLVIDPDYEASGPFAHWHDAGLIQLSAPVAAPPVRLATSQIWGPGTLGYTVGWGLTQPEGGLPAEMQVGETIVQSTSYCQSEIGSSFHPVAELCSLDYPSYKSATCNGDSGGPMLVSSNGELVEIGITSFGIGEGCPTYTPRVDTRADVESAWVQREIAAHPPKPSAGPPPSSSVPSKTTSPPAPTTTPELPRLTTAQAKRNAFNVVRTDPRLRRYFRVHAGYRASCRSTGTTAANCEVSWSSTADDYWGTVTVFEEWEGSEPVWNYRYSVRSVDDWCYWHSGHRGRCKVSLYRG